MSVTIKVDKYPHETDLRVFRSEELVFEPGFTVLIGCNGSGKSTTLGYIRHYCRRNDVPVIEFDNITDGGQHIASKGLFYGDTALGATAMVSSEGERILLALGRKSSEIGYFMRHNRSAKEVWILFDALDSGMSIDNIADFKEYLIKTILEDAPEGQNVYIVASANEYELARGEDCISVQTGKHFRFDDKRGGLGSYGRYYKEIMRSRRQKDKWLHQADR